MTTLEKIEIFNDETFSTQIEFLIDVAMETRPDEIMTTLAFLADLKSLIHEIRDELTIEEKSLQQKTEIPNCE